MAVYTREAATVFLMMCFQGPERNQPIAGWDKRVRRWVPLHSQRQIEGYLSQFPKADQN